MLPCIIGKLESELAIWPHSNLRPLLGLDIIRKKQDIGRKALLKADWLTTWATQAVILHEQAGKT
jgi:hypothetical protein